ncbi:DUF1433 domain-containing protein [Listeria booriae]|uniref:DUF1433 domain-containing protein n=1 Tax=Listeria booriae TaxID=1552123 RepID=UPI0016248A65|nr:DUF1433 domain-containing protein [Listeria booriae]MBC1531082.1 DUF1433 domain-containing protein [Listeria booriae]
MYQKGQQENALWDKQKPRIEKFYKYNYQRVESITFGKSYTFPNKTNVIEGYINNDKDLSFKAYVDPGTNFESEGTVSKDLSKLLKPEFQSKVMSVTDIQKKEKTSQE